LPFYVNLKYKTCCISYFCKLQPKLCIWSDWSTTKRDWVNVEREGDQRWSELKTPMSLDPPLFCVHASFHLILLQHYVS